LSIGAGANAASALLLILGRVRVTSMRMARKAELDAAINMLPFAGMQSVKDIPPDGLVKLDIKTLDGLTADQIVDR
jgi:hypothetical protein